MVIGIAGEKLSGKDAVFKIIRNYNVMFQNKKFSYNLKNILSILIGVPLSRFEDTKFKEEFYYNTKTGMIKHRSDIKDSSLMILTPMHRYPENCWVSIRCLLQEFGSEIVRSKFPLMWINGLFNNYNSLHSSWAITDVRHQNEVNAINERGGFVIRIIRNNDHSKTHSSELGVRNLTNIKYEVDNNSDLETGFLENAILEILKLENVKPYKPLNSHMV